MSGTSIVLIDNPLILHTPRGIVKLLDIPAEYK
jgi:hypothetical protein